MKVKLDENLGRLCAQRMADAGHDVATAVQQGLAGANDREVIDICRREGRCLVTLDLDFANPLRFRPAEYAGIAVLRLPARASMADMLDAIQTLISAGARDTITGQLWIVEKGRIRIYRPEADS